jgi:glycine cleavage system aminomethyltransferase T
MAETPQSKTFPHTPFVPYDPVVQFHETAAWCFGGDAEAWEYTGWRDEVLAATTTVSLHGHLNPSPTLRLTGPDALAFLSSVCVNSLATFRVGASRHAIMTDEQGRVAAHGMLLRLAEDDFVTYWLSPYLGYRLAQRPDLDVTAEDLTGRVFLFQLSGPRSLEVLEGAAEENLHDIRFLRHRLASIAGAEVRVIRIGMSGTLAYEVHGPVEHAIPVYEALMAAGEEYGIRKMGVQAYMCQHTQGGFGQMYYHFPLPWGEDENLQAFFAGLGFPPIGKDLRLHGSAGTDMDRRYRTPYELGWGHMVKFDHDFIGREALEREAAEAASTMVTLVWDPEDVAEVYLSQFRKGAEHPYMNMPNHFMYEVGDRQHQQSLWADRVLVNGRDVGTSSGRCFSVHSGEMLSLATVETAVAEEGTEVVVLWGDPGTRQKEIRATVARFPYLVDPVRNEKFDVSVIPSKYEPATAAVAGGTRTANA